MKIHKIYVVAAIHGDEPFGLKVIGHLMSSSDPRIITRVGHPEAVAKRREFLEANLNRCFGPDAPKSKETQVARHIMNDIKFHNPDLIIDIHTCECRVGKSAIIVDPTEDLLEVARGLGIEFVVEGDDEVAPQALFGQFPDKALVIELGRSLRSDRLAATLAKRIVELLDDAAPKPIAKLKLYSKTRTISNHEAKGLKIENYEYNRELGGYPYLVGANTYYKYENYVGFLSEEEKLV